MTIAMQQEGGPSGPYGPTFQLIPGVQSYDWGKLAKQGSLVAKFGQATDELKFEREEDKPYAELWMGTHSTLPSKIIPPPSTSSSNPDHSPKYATLSSYLEQHPSLVGDRVQQHFFPDSGSDSSSRGRGDLPFLFKVLSIGKALSIQAHPDKSLAKKLHAEKPKMYKDDNHKPEMAIALTQFKGFCGFRPLEEMATFLVNVPEFKAIVKPSETLLSDVEKIAQQLRSGANVDTEKKKDLLRKIFAQLMEADPSEVQKAVEKISKRYGDGLDRKGGSRGLEVKEDLAQLVCTLNEQFPGDVGVLCAFVLNVAHLQPGESMFLMANEPHAYLEGDIIECMAASDNVVRAGLTPKARDVKVLIEMLTYSDEASDKKRMKAKPFLPDSKSKNINAYTSASSSSSASSLPSSSKELDSKEAEKIPSLLYDPPIEEFSVIMTRLAKGSAPELHRPIQGPSIVILTSGNGTLTSIPHPDSKAENRQFSLSRPGQVFFVGADTRIELQAGQDDLVLFRAFVEVP